MLGFGAGGTYTTSMAPMPSDIAEKLVAIGRVIDPPRTQALYAGLHDNEPYPGAVVTRDIKYGPDTLQALDLFTQEGAGARPVLIHLHGGAFERGDKHTPGTPFSDNITLWAARNGMVGVNANYRLAPAAQWPSGPRDVAAILRWVKATIASHGGDPARVYLVGSSAGANHIASYLAFAQFQRPDASPVAGAIFLSGSPFDTETFPMKNYERYFGPDTARYAALSPIPGLIEAPLPLMVVHAALDPLHIEKDSTRLIAALEKAGRKPRAVFLKTHNHLSGGASIGTKDTELSDTILAFVTAGR
jgi:triacylglycerol lipase